MAFGIEGERGSVENQFVLAADQVDVDGRDAVPASTAQALRDYALMKIGDDDADETGVAAKAVQK